MHFYAKLATFIEAHKFLGTYHHTELIKELIIHRK